ncbi:DUF378 domain-containing protein [Candidatus Falkowbacteria bacterium]|nr:DUF378 domain-containing protein [Candidatus Falkowbacteria bacterium]
MKSLTSLDWTALILIIVGGLNWGLIGLFKFDLVATLFGDMTMLSRIIYTVVGVSSVYTIAIAMNLARK